MRIESSVTSLSWIPSEAVVGPINTTVFRSGITHYDRPLPDHINDLDALRSDDAFRFGNRLEAWAEVEDARIVAAGHTGGGLMGATTLRLGRRSATFAAVEFPDLRNEPELGGESVRFTQTAGGHTALPGPRRVAHPPFVKWEAPTVWTTLELVIHADGNVERSLTGASAFPRHWLYDHLDLVAKAGLADFTEWFRHSFGIHTPWGDADTPALVTTIETALERQLSSVVMGGARPDVRELPTGATLTRQGELSNGEVYLLLDGVLCVEVDGEVVAEIGPGAILGERAALEEGRRTSTLIAHTRVRVAAATDSSLDPDALAEVAAGHRREVG